MVESTGYASFSPSSALATLAVFHSHVAPGISLDDCPQHPVTSTPPLSLTPRFFTWSPATHSYFLSFHKWHLKGRFFSASSLFKSKRDSLIQLFSLSYLVLTTQTKSTSTLNCDQLIWSAQPPVFIVSLWSVSSPAYSLKNDKPLFLTQHLTLSVQFWKEYTWQYLWFLPFVGLSLLVFLFYSKIITT